MPALVPSAAVRWTRPPEEAGAASGVSERRKRQDGTQENTWSRRKMPATANIWDGRAISRVECCFFFVGPNHSDVRDTRCLALQV